MSSLFIVILLRPLHMWEPFWHAGNEGDCWIYLWATIAIWVIQLAARAWDKTALFDFFHADEHHWKKTGDAEVQLLDDSDSNATMIQITVQAAMEWTPGQHVFLGFPALGMLDNHPFTIASVVGWQVNSNLRSANEDLPAQKTVNSLLFLVRPYNGLTKRLYAHARKLSGSDPEVDAKQEPSL